MRLNHFDRQVSGRCRSRVWLRPPPTNACLRRRLQADVIRVFHPGLVSRSSHASDGRGQRSAIDASDVGGGIIPLWS